MTKTKTLDQLMIDVIAQSGLTPEEMEEIAEASHHATLNRIKELAIELPFPIVLPSNVHLIRDTTSKNSLARDWIVTMKPQGKGFKETYKMVVGATIHLENDGKLWYHVSYSRKSSIPTYEDSCFVKKHFIGEDRAAIAIFPRRTEHVNIHEFTLHLWTCLEGDVLPDFRKFGAI